MGRSFLAVLIGINFFMSATAGINNIRLTNLLTKLEGKYGELAVLVSQPETGKILFEYGKNILWQQRKAPGSLLKPFTLLAYNKKYPLRAEQTHDCPGFREYTPEKICWFGPGHGRLNLREAIAHSCNDYFYHQIVKDKLKQNDLQKLLENLGIKRPYNFLLPKKDFERSAVGLDAYVQVIPGQVLFAYNALYNGGRVYDQKRRLIHQEQISDYYLAILREGMRGAAIFGTAKKLQEVLPGSPLLAKSGTGAGLISERYDWRRTVGWMVAFYPLDKPRLSVLVFVKKGTGAGQATDIAGVVLKEILK